MRSRAVGKKHGIARLLCCLVKGCSMHTIMAHNTLLAATGWVHDAIRHACTLCSSWTVAGCYVGLCGVDD